jgi:hypothetical protein
VTRGPKPNQELRHRIYNLLLADASSFSDIGKQLNLSRERVRQIAKELNVNGRLREHYRHPWNPHTFLWTIKGWLKTIDCDYCRDCKQIKPLAKMSTQQYRTTKSIQCKDCYNISMKVWRIKNARTNQL